MSDLSKALGLDKPANKPVLTAINTVGGVALATVEAAVPGSTAVIQAIEKSTGTSVVLVPATTLPAAGDSAGATIQVIAVDAGKIAVQIDPNLDTQIIAALNAALARWHVGFLEGSLDSIFQEEIGKFLPAPVTPAPA